MSVKILKLSRGFDRYAWLCDPCVKAAEEKGWDVRGRKTPPHPLKCDECGTDDARPAPATRAA